MNNGKHNAQLADIKPMTHISVKRVIMEVDLYAIQQFHRDTCIKVTARIQAAVFTKGGVYDYLQCIDPVAIIQRWLLIKNVAVNWYVQCTSIQIYKYTYMCYTDTHINMCINYRTISLPACQSKRKNNQ